MASFSDVIKVDIDVVSSKATAGLGDVKAKMAEAEGGFGKLKAASGGVFDTLKAAGPLAVAGIGAAIGGMVVKGINDFKNLAISAENFSTVAGTTVQDASRWIEVAGDLGVETDAVQGAMGRLNREAETGALAKFGITAQDANGRLIETLQYLASIPDEAKRSQASFELFGKSGASMAPLIANVSELKDRLAEVSGAKIITPDDVADAKKFRDEMDRITDAIDNLVLSAGKIALPFIEALAEIGGPIAEMIGQLADLRAEAQKKADDSGSSWTDKVIGFFTQTGPEAGKLFLDSIDAVTGGTGERFRDMGDKALELGDIVEGQGQKFVVLADETKLVTGMTDDQIAALVEQARVQQAAGLATDESAGSQKAADAALKETNERIKAQTKALGDMTKALGDQQAAALGAINSELGYRQSVAGVEDAVTKVQEAQVEAVKQTDAHGASSMEAALAARDLKRAGEDLEGSILTTAAAAQQYAKDQAAASGATFTTYDGVLAQKGALEELKQKFPELSGGIDTYIAKLDGIPHDIDTEVRAHEVGLQNIINQLENLPRQVFIDFRGALHVGGAATGGPHSGLTMVGEKGPELVVLPDGSFVYTASQTQQLLSHGMAGGGIYGPVTAGAPATRPQLPPEYQMFGQSHSTSMAYSSGQSYWDRQGNTSWTVPVKTGVPSGPAAIVAAGRDTASNLANHLNVTINVAGSIVGASKADVGRWVVDAVTVASRTGATLPASMVR